MTFDACCKTVAAKLSAQLLQPMHPMLSKCPWGPSSEVLWARVMGEPGADENDDEREQVHVAK
jgi:hypothetical protein